MGVYDGYGKAQIKVGDCLLRSYKIGDTVSIPDGVYIDYGAVIVIKDSIFIAEFDELINKYGNAIPADPRLHFDSGKEGF
jgi:hypothetical protein